MICLGLETKIAIVVRFLHGTPLKPTKYQNGTMVLWTYTTMLNCRQNEDGRAYSKDGKIKQNSADKTNRRNKGLEPMVVKWPHNMSIWKNVSRWCLYGSAETIKNNKKLHSHDVKKWRKLNINFNSFRKMTKMDTFGCTYENFVHQTADKNVRYACKSSMNDSRNDVSIISDVWVKKKRFDN